MSLTFLSVEEVAVKRAVLSSCLRIYEAIREPFIKIT